jgi:Zn-dependent protease
VFTEPSQTAFDLRFRLLGVFVRVHPFFWLGTVLLGSGVAGSTRDGRAWLIHILIWTACVFVSILVHELGHVFMGRLFGSDGHIVLHGFGGLAVGSNLLPRRWQRFLVSFAGPLAQFALLGVVALNLLFLPPVLPADWRDYVELVLLYLFIINLFWPVLNLLPVWPLDGGQMAREVFGAFLRDRGWVVTLAVSAAVAGLLALHCLLSELGRPLIPQLAFIGGFYTAIFFGYLCFTSLQALQLESSRRRRRDDEYHWDG